MAAKAPARTQKKTTRSPRSTPDKRRTAHKPLGPFTIDHFRRWAGLCVLDNGRFWELEPFQLEIIEDIFAGYREVLVVLPTGNYKTTTCSGLSLYYCQYTPDAAIPIGASSKRQAGIMYRQAWGFVRRTPGLKKRFKVSKTVTTLATGITCLESGGVIEVYSSSHDSGDGIIPRGIVFLDELHRHRGHDLYGTWRDKLTKAGATMVIPSTAGGDENNPLEELRDSALKLPHVKRRGRYTVARSTGREFVMHQYALTKKDDPDDLDIVLLANPASQVNREELRMRHDSPSTKRWQWLRMTCNLRASGEESAIEPDVWDDFAEADLKVAVAAPIYGWLDLGWKIDTSAMGILAWERHDRRLITDVTVIAPPVDEADIVVGLLGLQARHGDALVGIVYDPNAGGQQMAQQLEKGEHPLQYDDEARARKRLAPLNGKRLPPLRFINHSQDNAPMALASSRFDEALRNGWIRHDGDPDLRSHVLNAIERQLGGGGEKWRYDRPQDQLGGGRRKYPIDCLTGVVMGHSVAVAEHGEPDEPPLDISDYRISVL